MKELAAAILTLVLATVGRTSTVEACRKNYGQSPTLRYVLTDAQGGQHSERDIAHSRAAVFFFIANECPISNRYAPEVNRIVDDYSSRGFSFFAVHSDPDETAEQVRNHSQEFKYKFPALLDPEQKLASSFEVLATPTAVVVSPAGEILYRGRIDNRYLDFGKFRDAGIESDLRVALDSLVDSKRVANRFTKTIGCALPPPRKGFVRGHSH